MLATCGAAELVTYSPIGTAIYDWAVAGSPGAAIAPFSFGSPPAE